MGSCWTKSAFAALAGGGTLPLPHSYKKQSRYFLIYVLGQILIYVVIDSGYARPRNCCVKERTHEARRVHFRPSLSWRNGVRRRQNAGAALTCAESREPGITMVDSS